MSWHNFCEFLLNSHGLTINVFQKKAQENWSSFRVYPYSVHTKEGTTLFLLKDENEKKLVVIGSSGLSKDFQGTTEKFKNEQVKICPLSPVNATALRHHFPFTAPVSLQNFPITVGLGDRLGIASPGHLRLLRKHPNARPILAQQSIRELNLTGRNYQQVLDAATWAVFQEDYQLGFGADGDHLKTAAEVKMALDCGFTMITLDCSEHINNNVPGLTPAEITAEYEHLPMEIRAKYEKGYLNQTFDLKDFHIQLDPLELKKIVLIYDQAINHTVKIYQEVILPAGKAVDFEVSIDETLTPTSPSSHFLVAKELTGLGVKIASMAPRFCGEFQKGIDYIGDPKAFEIEFHRHVQIAAHFGYKISVHSGSDKFSVFPIVGRETGGRFHLKTAGTNWLEAVRIIAQKDPAMFREIYGFALENLNEAKKYYHISAVPDRVPSLNGLQDADLPKLLDRNDSRQILHITYGLILQAKNQNNQNLFRDRIFSLLYHFEEDYNQNLENHIGKHLAYLEI